MPIDCVSRGLTTGTASSVKRKGMGVALLKEVSWPQGTFDGLSADTKRAATSGGGGIVCRPKTDDSKRWR